jgi:hypothetical protein
MDREDEHPPRPLVEVEVPAAQIAESRPHFAHVGGAHAEDGDG